MRTAIYARVSTSEQTADPQLDRLREYVAARGTGTQVAVEFVDEGVSGRKDRRPALDRLMAAARRREVDAIAVVKLDRLARSVRHLTQLVGELEALGVDLVVLDQGIDTSTPAGRLLFHVIGAIAEFETDLIRERTVAGVEAARKRGARIGRPEVTDQRMRERIVRLSQVGRKSTREIAALVGVSKSTVARIVRAAA
jgi:DNA invertase Pin-like site-specific DNA recombinase